MLLINLVIIGSFMLYKTSDPIGNRNDVFPEVVRNLVKKVSGSEADEIGKYILEQ